MTNIATALALIALVVVGMTAASGLANAGVDSPFYPDHFKNPNPSHPSVGAGSGIPSPYRLGD
jgi:hypothetical protein